MKHSDFFDETKVKSFVQPDFNPFSNRLARKIWRDDEWIVKRCRVERLRFLREGDFNGSNDAFILCDINAF